MKVIKVIVDELPNSCNLCPFSLQDDGYHFCCARSLLEDEHELTMKNIIQERPDWCPIMTEAQLFSERIDTLNIGIDMGKKAKDG